MKTYLIASIALAAASVSHAEVVTYKADPSHTFVTFEVKHLGTSTVRARFDKKDGMVTLDRAAKTGSVEFTIDTTSISSGLATFDTHLKSKDFFNVAEVPTAKFSGDKLSFNGDKLSSVTGTLTLLGKTLPVTLTATHFNCYDHPMLKREVCGGDFETTITRTQWGMSFGLNYGIPDNVKLLVQVEAVKQ